MIPLPCPDFNDVRDPEQEVKETVRIGSIIPIMVSFLATIPHITPQTFLRILQGEFDQTFEKWVVLDCRFQHEYVGGHVCGALNLTTLEELKELYDYYLGRQVCFVFHCEFSQERGPMWAQTFREFDRIRNLKEERGHKLHYPCIYIVHGGYQAIFGAVGQVTTGSYKQMHDIANEMEEKSFIECQANFRHKSRRVCDRQTLWALADPNCRIHPIQIETVSRSLSHPSDFQITARSVSRATSRLQVQTLERKPLKCFFPSV
jgi:rhodanese-related sulfurtransferase